MERHDRPGRRTRPVRRTRRALAAVAVGALATTGAVALVHDRAEDRVESLVTCHLPPGVEVTDVDLSPRTLVTELAGRLGVGWTGGSGGSGGSRDTDVRVTVSADADAVRAVVAGSGLGPAASPPLTISAGVLRVGLPRGPVSASVEVRPSVVDGTLRLTPERIRIGGRTFAPELLQGVLPIGSEALRPRDLPPLDLPAGELSAVAVVGDRLVVDAVLPAGAAGAPPADAPTCTAD